MAVSDMSDSIDVAGKPEPVFQNHHYVGNGVRETGRLVVGKKGFPVSEMDERKRRRMQSNRESARRSRVRKQKHLDDLRALLNRLGAEKRYMSNKLGTLNLLRHQLLLESSRLRSEQAELHQYLAELRRILATMCLVSGIPATGSGCCHISDQGMINQQPSSLIA